MVGARRQFRAKLQLPQFPLPPTIFGGEHQTNFAADTKIQKADETVLNKWLTYPISVSLLMHRHLM
jgi:hypothetical protein